MIAARLRWALGVSLLTAAGSVAIAGTIGAAADSAEDLLKDRGLKRVGTTYVLALEGEVQKKTVELRAQHNQLVTAARRQANVESAAVEEQGMARELLRERVALNDQIGAFDQQLRNLGTPGPGNGFGIMQRNELIAQRNQVVNVYNGIADRLRLLQASPATDPRVRDQLRTEVSRRREGYIEAVLGLRRLVDSATKAYADLAADAAVTDAIDAVGRTSKAKPKLGPSAQFAANVKLLEKIEQSVISDAVDLHKRGGVFWVDATFNGKVTRPMVFDTGASLTTIPTNLAEEMGLKPSPSDPIVRCETADGTVVEARQMTIPSMRVGRFTISDVDCAVMPPGKGNIAPLLGQSFHRHFTYKFTPESGHLVMSKVDGLEPQAKAQPARAKARAKTRAAKTRGDAGRAAPGGAAGTDQPG